MCRKSWGKMGISRKLTNDRLRQEPAFLYLRPYVTKIAFGYHPVRKSAVIIPRRPWIGDKADPWITGKKKNFLNLQLPSDPATLQIPEPPCNALRYESCDSGDIL